MEVLQLPVASGSTPSAVLAMQPAGLRYILPFEPTRWAWYSGMGVEIPLAFMHHNMAVLVLPMFGACLALRGWVRLMSEAPSVCHETCSTYCIA